MEASFFRFLAAELDAKLTGGRIEKVHGPAEDVTILTLYGQGRKEQLIARPAKPAGLLFLADSRPASPLVAPTRVMWLRKRLAGRKILSCRADWPGLRLACALSPRDIPEAGRWLVLDLRAGLALAEDFPEPPAPAWPALPQILDDPEVWRAHPQITPPLRKHLAALAQADPPGAARLLARLAAGESEGFFLPPQGPPLAWDPGLPGTERFATALAAARAHGERSLYAGLAKAENAEALDQAAQARKRLRRQAELLDKDAERHRALAELARPAEALQIALSGLPAAPVRVESMPLPHPELGTLDVPLDPRLTPAENMARLFRLAAKGRRGLAHVERRRAELPHGAPGPVMPTATAPGKNAPAAPPPLPKRYQGLAVACFRSSDGFLILRGKSSQANHDMLSRAAAPHDYWLHAAGGPSAHVILRRDHPGQDVPERSLLEAAGLCALKSWRKDDARAEVLLALVKDVRKVKGAAIGSVAVDQVERTLVVAPDPALEERLRLAPA